MINWPLISVLYHITTELALRVILPSQVVGDNAMNSKTLKKVLATAGIAYLGVISADTVAFAQAIQARSPDALVEFIRSNAQSTYVEDAVRLANAMIVPAAAQSVTLRGAQLDDSRNSFACDDRDCGEGGKGNRAGY